MSNARHPFLSVVRSERNDALTGNNQQKSPYLKAILSGTAGAAVVKKILSAVSSDTAAASRYIKESAFLRKA